MDGVEFAARRTQTAADAAICVNDGRAAFEAAVCLFFDLLLGQRQAQIVEGLRRVARLAAGCLARSVVIALDADIVAVKFDKLAQVAAEMRSA